MAETITQTWEQELMARGEARGREKGLAEGQMKGQLEECRETLRVVLEERFGSLPEALAQRIAAEDDLERLHAALRRAVKVETLADLEL